MVEDDETCKVAVYGTLKKGQVNHIAIKGATHKITQELTGWVMYNLGNYPTIIETGNDCDQIMVEIYEMPKFWMKTLDRIEGYPRMYNRKIVQTEVGKAFIYFWNGFDITKRIKTGTW